MTNKTIRTSSQWLLIILLITSSILPGVSDSVAATTENASSNQSIDNMQDESEESVDVWMPDKNLQQAVANQLNISISDITKDKLQNLIKLSALMRSIDSIQGLEYATNLTDLDLMFNNISDISYLSNLIHLRSLNLNENQNINDISSLNNLLNLEALQLGGNQISDITPLSDLKNLNFLNLTDNQISNINAVSNLINLNDFSASSNQISDVTPLTGLNNLTSLNLNRNQISDISPISGLTSLETLSVGTNQIKDVSSLRNLTNITGWYSLNIQSNQITDISSLGAIDKESIWADFQNATLPKQVAESIEEIKIKNPIKGLSVVQPYLISIDNIQDNSNVLYYPEEDTFGFRDLSVGTHQVQLKWESETGPYDSNKFEGSANFELEVVPQVGANVTVHYVDESGKSIPNVSSQTISGNVGDSYDASTDTYKLIIDGYTLDESKLPSNGKGTLSEQAQTVTYVYTKNPVKATDVTINYVDESGEAIPNVSSQTISGNVGDSYDASTDTYKLKIDGYTLDESKLPTNAKGTLSDQAQTVTYVYIKSEVNPANSESKPDNKLGFNDKNNKQGTTATTQHGLPATGENERMTRMSIILGLVLLSVGMIISIFRFKKVNK